MSVYQKNLSMPIRILQEALQDESRGAAGITFFFKPTTVCSLNLWHILLNSDSQTRTSANTTASPRHNPAWAGWALKTQVGPLTNW